MERWNVFEVILTDSDSFSNPFWDVNVTARFTSPTDEVHVTHGFHDGGSTWRIRFSPNEVGRWSYSWSKNTPYGTESGGGVFDCTEQSNPLIRGPVRLSDVAPGALEHEDGTGFYWIGGKWLLSGPDPEEPPRISTLPALWNWQRVRDYLDYISSKGLNGYLVKCAQFPLNNDMRSFNLDHISNMEQVIEYCAERGIICQFGFFDAWAKPFDWGGDPRDPHQTNPDLQILQPWNPNTYVEETDFYLRYLCSRLSHYWNIWWELGNEMIYTRQDFEPAARVYIPKIREYDPYNHLIGMSYHHEAMQVWDIIDIAHAHNTRALDMWNKAIGMPWDGLPGVPRPTCWNELPFIDSQADDPNMQRWFRNAFYWIYVAGGAGASEISWMYHTHIPNQVTEYHSIFASIINGLDHRYWEPDDFVIAESPTTNYHAGRAQDGSFALAYFYSPQSPGTAKPRPTSLRRLAHNTRFKYEWWDPKTGHMLLEGYVDTGEQYTISVGNSPEFYDDVVLKLYVEGGQPPPPPPQQQWQLDVGSSPVNVEMVVDGENKWTPFAIMLDAGNHNLVVPVIASDGETNYSFAGWDNGATTPEIEVSLTGNFSVRALYDLYIPPDDFNVTNVIPTEYVLAQLREGDCYYIDRDYSIQTIPQQLRGLLWILTANDDKSHTSAEFLSFHVAEPVQIYVAYDSRSQPPDWLTMSYQNTGLTIQVTDAAENLVVWTRTYQAGTIRLGANNAQGATGARCMYVVIIGSPLDQPTPLISTLSLSLVDISGNPSHSVDVDVAYFVDLDLQGNPNLSGLSQLGVTISIANINGLDSEFSWAGSFQTTGGGSGSFELLTDLCLAPNPDSTQDMIRFCMMPSHQTKEGQWQISARLGNGQEEQTTFLVNAFFSLTIDKTLLDFGSGAPGGSLDAELGLNYDWNCAISILVSGIDLSDDSGQTILPVSSINFGESFESLSVLSREEQAFVVEQHTGSKSLSLYLRLRIPVPYPDTRISGQILITVRQVDS